MVSTEQTLDYETQKLYEFSVGATDESSTTSTANVTVTVLDVNDNRPVFGQSDYSTTVTEDSVVGREVSNLTAIDADSDTNGQLSYSITRGNNQGTFHLDSASGTLTTASTLDRETTASYNLTVQAIDGGSPALSLSINVTITISDVNDNPPVFEKTMYTATLPSDAQKEWSFTVIATDRDSGSNGTITYSISSGNEAGLFTINPESGEIRVEESFDAEKFPKFTLTVQGMDGTLQDKFRNMGQATVTINVDNGSTTSTGAASDESTPYGSTASLHSLKLLLYPLLPSLVLLVSATLGM